MKLLAISNVKSALETHAEEHAAFKINWNTVKDWKEQSRYEVGMTEAGARGMYDAVANSESGVVQWLKTQW